MTQASDNAGLLAGLIEKAAAAGADAADAVLVEATSLSLSRRLGKPEKLERSEMTDLGLRVLLGKRQAMVSSSDVSAGAVEELVERAVAMVRVVPEDPHCGLAEPGQLADDDPDLDSRDPQEPTAETLADWAARAEEAAMGVPGVTNSEGAEANWSRAMVSMAASNGFNRCRSVSHFGLGASVLAGEGTAKERDYDYTAAVFAEDLRPPEEVGRQAGEWAVRRLGPGKVESAEMPVVYHPRVARTLLGHLSSAINGAAVARGTTFLKDRLEESVFPARITIVDDPRRRRGLRSKPFDGEGLATARRNLIDGGVLTTWLLDLRSARQLGMTSTGHAARGTSSPPSPSATNLYLEPGEHSPQDLMADIENGLYVTELMGFGINVVTGDYSRGASGFRIEKGEVAHPVSEITVAGNLIDMFARLTAADDLEFLYGTDAPTIRVDGMTVAGK